MQIDPHPLMALIRELNGEQGKRSMLDVVAELDWHEPPWDARIPEGEGAFFDDRGGGQYSFSTRDTEACIATFNIGHKRWEPSLEKRLRKGTASQGFSVLSVGFALKGRHSLVLECGVINDEPLKLTLDYRGSEVSFTPNRLLSRELPNQIIDVRQFVEKGRYELPSNTVGLLDWFQKLVKIQKVGAIFAATLMLEAVVDHKQSVLQRFHKPVRVAA